jgi:hypothetical protein
MSTLTMHTYTHNTQHIPQASPTSIEPCPTHADASCAGATCADSSSSSFSSRARLLWRFQDSTRCSGDCTYTLIYIYKRVCVDKHSSRLYSPLPRPLLLPTHSAMEPATADHGILKHPPYDGHCGACMSRHPTREAAAAAACINTMY